MSNWTLAWIIWAVVVVGGFFVIEFAALATVGSRGTLTNTVVRNIDMELAVAIFGLLFAALPVWLWTHFKVRYAKKAREAEGGEE